MYSITDHSGIKVGSLISASYHFLRRNFLLFAAIVLILTAGNYIHSGFRSVQLALAELPELKQTEKEIDAHRMSLASRLSHQVNQGQGATVNKLDGKIVELEGGIRKLELEKESLSPLSGALSTARNLPAYLVTSIKRAVELELLHQAKDYLVTLRAYAEAGTNRKAAFNRLEQLRQAHAQVYARLSANLTAQSQLKASSPLAVRIPFLEGHNRMNVLKMEEQNLRAQNDLASKAYKTQSDLIQRLPTLSAPGAFRIDEARISAHMEPLRDRIQQVQRLVGQNVLWQIYSAVLPVLPAAIAIMIGAYLIPAGIRIIFYFVFAPLASRRPAIVIDGSTNGEVYAYEPTGNSESDAEVISSVSKTITLAPDQELLIHPGYSQSLPVGLKTSTKVLFNWSCPITSIAAHLWMLKRVQTLSPVGIVVSSTVDPLDEVAVLEIPLGGAFVLQPRGLVGIVFPVGEAPRIQKHWRLLSLHAWLTLQLRYLSFQGPVTLIVKGCRGVRLERAGAGRTISQSATLGFSANTTYTTIRAEPFIPYLNGSQPLLQDQFVGPDSYYLQEEVPRDVATGKKRHNPLEMLFDAGLKAFGI